MNGTFIQGHRIKADCCFKLMEVDEFDMPYC
jgi:hypothetical protein